MKKTISSACISNLPKDISSKSILNMMTPGEAGLYVCLSRQFKDGRMEFYDIVNNEWHEQSCHGLRNCWTEGTS